MRHLVYGAARAVFSQQAAVFYVDVAVAQLFCVAGAGAPEFAEEVEDLLDEAGGLCLRFIVVGQQVVEVFVAAAAGRGTAVQRLGLEHALAQAVVGVLGGGGVFALAGAGALLYVATAKTRAKASRGWSLLALPGLEQNWPLALDRKALAAINLGVFNSCWVQAHYCVLWLLHPAAPGFPSFKIPARVELLDRSHAPAHAAP